MTDNSEIPVVYYHSISPVVANWHRNFLTIQPEAFRKHLEYFSRNFTVISLKDLWLIRTGQAEPVRSPLVITFDDGYSDNYTWAFPLLLEYNIRATIFISPAFADERNIIRSQDDPQGFLSWNEMRIMEASGLVDIQSHTMTHTKFFVSDKIKGFHHPGGDILYPVINDNSKGRMYVLNDPEFERRLPFGYPLFEESSAVTARKVIINPEFIEGCVERFSNYDFSRYDFRDAFRIVESLYYRFKREEKLITSTETEVEYLARVNEEILGSKRIIEAKLDKTVEFLCWPHGDNSQLLHEKALESGYLMTTKGKVKGMGLSDTTRIPERLGIDFRTWQKKQKTIFKLKAFSGEFPYALLLKLFRRSRKYL